MNREKVTSKGDDFNSYCEDIDCFVLLAIIILIPFLISYSYFSHFITELKIHQIIWFYQVG